MPFHRFCDIDAVLLGLPVASVLPAPPATVDSPRNSALVPSFDGVSEEMAWPPDPWGSRVKVFGCPSRCSCLPIIILSMAGFLFRSLLTVAFSLVIQTLSPSLQVVASSVPRYKIAQSLRRYLAECLDGTVPAPKTEISWTTAIVPPFILGDYAYASSKHVVMTFELTVTRRIPVAKELNNQLASFLVVVKWAFGILKF
ncbi:MAG: hypothetical protein BJ554DRAFT_3622, partial [Olpidium bornovanus]